MWDQTYPRPQMRRESYLPLNGPWLLNGREIILPFPPQATLSGYQGKITDSLCYERDFDVPAEWLQSGGRLLLHFGAVDQTAEVVLNGRTVARHEGGYLPFEADITGDVRKSGNALRVMARDALEHRFPYGKQSKRPKGMWYTPVSGIWQTVWLERVPERYMEGLTMIPDLNGITLTVKSASEGFAEALVDGRRIQVPLNTPVYLKIDRPHLWRPEDPYLYPLSVTFGEDRVESYFALRTVEILPNGYGKPRICLNKEPVFLNGLLDQGYFPDGLFLPGDPAEYERDILRARKMGFQTLRKHVKVEPEAFYYACDRLGMLVIQDMVNSGPYHYIHDTVLPNIGLKRSPPFFSGNPARKAFFERHCQEEQEHLRNHPSVIGYTIFNEGWGQYDTMRFYRTLKARDPSRFYISASGWFKGYETDVDSDHIYFRNTVLRQRERPLLLSECGGYTLNAAPSGDHRTYGYGVCETKEALTAKIERLYAEMVLPSIERGLNGVIYTQLTDVEGEINGLYTYDRSVEKALPDRLRALSETCRSAFEKTNEKSDENV